MESKLLTPALRKRIKNDLAMATALAALCGLPAALALSTNPAAGLMLLGSFVGGAILSFVDALRTLLRLMDLNAGIVPLD